MDFHNISLGPAGAVPSTLSPLSFTVEDVGLHVVLNTSLEIAWALASGLLRELNSGTRPCGPPLIINPCTFVKACLFRTVDQHLAIDFSLRSHL